MTLPNHIQITPELVASHGLKPDEYQRILDLIGREPTFTELGIFSAMWNEHCSYKSSKKWLKTLPTKGPRVIQGLARMPAWWTSTMATASSSRWRATTTRPISSPIRVRQPASAAFCVVFTMGARPIAAMNALRFARSRPPKTRHSWQASLQAWWIW